MAQHLLIADLAAPLLLVGVRNPVLGFYLPRAALVTLARSPLRRWFDLLKRPLVAVPVFVLVLYGWHFSVFFEAAVRNPFVHALQHMSFVAIGVLVWWSALEPKRRRLRGELWKVAVRDRRADGRDAARHELRADPRADLHRRLRGGRPRARVQRARRPADGGRHDGLASTC